MAKATKIEMNVDLVVGEIMNVWNSIAGDLDACCEEAGERMTNAAAIEACIDANRMTQFASSFGKERAKEAEAEVHRAITVYGYGRVLLHLSRKVSLV
jgi:hypothetical protein